MGGVGGLLVGLVLGDGNVVLGLDLLLGLGTTLLEGAEVTLALETLGGDKALDLGCLGVCLAGLGGDLAANNVLADVVLLGEVEEAADLGSTLGCKTLGEDGVGKTGDLVLTLLDDNEGKDLDVGADDAATNRLALALTSAAGTVTRVSVGEEETGTVVEEDTLLHGETLLVVTA